MNTVPTSPTITLHNAVFLLEELSVNQILLSSDGRHTPIKTDSAEISIPLGELAASTGNTEVIKVASFLFSNMSGLLPEGLSQEFSNG